MRDCTHYKITSNPAFCHTSRMVFKVDGALILTRTTTLRDSNFFTNYDLSSVRYCYSNTNGPRQGPDVKSVSSLTHKA